MTQLLATHPRQNHPPSSMAGNHSATSWPGMAWGVSTCTSDPRSWDIYLPSGHQSGGHWTHGPVQLHSPWLPFARCSIADAQIARLRELCPLPRLPREAEGHPFARCLIHALWDCPLWTWGSHPVPSWVSTMWKHTRGWCLSTSSSSLVLSSCSYFFTFKKLGMR
jgi:hypothetical protein